MYIYLSIYIYIYLYLSINLTMYIFIYIYILYKTYTYKVTTHIFWGWLLRMHRLSNWQEVSWSQQSLLWKQERLRLRSYWKIASSSSRSALTSKTKCLRSWVSVSNWSFAVLCDSYNLTNDEMENTFIGTCSVSKNGYHGRHHKPQSHTSLHYPDLFNLAFFVVTCCTS